METDGGGVSGRETAGGGKRSGREGKEVAGGRGGE